MDLREKVMQALGNVVRVEQTVLWDDGLIAFVVSPDFRGQDSYTRQTVIMDALRSPGANLSTEEIAKVAGFVAFTPEEFAVHGPELHPSA
jgi:hypothetical protein